jgi:hypothetical protein
MEVWTDIAVQFQVEALMKVAHVDPHNEDGRQFRAIVAEAQPLARPKAMYKDCYVDGRGDDKSYRKKPS